jgi:hypothetical protein
LGNISQLLVSAWRMAARNSNAKKTALAITQAYQTMDRLILRAIAAEQKQPPCAKRF